MSFHDVAKNNKPFLGLYKSVFWNCSTLSHSDDYNDTFVFGEDEIFYKVTCYG